MAEGVSALWCPPTFVTVRKAWKSKWSVSGWFLHVLACSPKTATWCGDNCGNKYGGLGSQRPDGVRAQDI